MGASAYLAAIRVATPMGLGPEVRADALDEPEVERRVADYLVAHPQATRVAQHLRAAALLWHDRLDASHRVSQELGDADGAYLHGLMHRREPDYDNAKYWFARVGDHPLLPLVAREARTLGLDPGASERRTAYAVVDLVSRAVAGDAPAAPMVTLQEREFARLIEHLHAR